MVTKGRTAAALPLDLGRRDHGERVRAGPLDRKTAASLRATVARSHPTAQILLQRMSGLVARLSESHSFLLARGWVVRSPWHLA